MGVVLDGCPAGVEISQEEICAELRRRAPGVQAWTSPRREPDQPEILSGVFRGKTTGHPISILIRNKDADSSKYQEEVVRPGHATYTYMEKYGAFDFRGGGRASARETVGRVAAAAVAKKLLKHYGTDVTAYLKQVGEVVAKVETQAAFQERNADFFCPDGTARAAMVQQLQRASDEGDSLGGVVEFQVQGAEAGLGDPIYEKIQAKLGSALFSIPAVKGVELGSGFQASQMRGSDHNDPMEMRDGKAVFKKNDAGGLLGGITTGEVVTGRVAFKPPSSIQKSQKTVTLEKEEICYSLPEGSRHDPCVAIRGVVVVEAMVALVFADAYLMKRCSRL